MVKHPNWTTDLFTEEELTEIENNNGWSIGIVHDPETNETFKALIEHFDNRFPGEVKAYPFTTETEFYAYETPADHPDNSPARYVETYLQGHFA